MVDTSFLRYLPFCHFLGPIISRVPFSLLRRFNSLGISGSLTQQRIPRYFGFPPTRRSWPTAVSEQTGFPLAALLSLFVWMVPPPLSSLLAFGFFFFFFVTSPSFGRDFLTVPQSFLVACFFHSGPRSAFSSFFQPPPFFLSYNSFFHQRAFLAGLVFWRAGSGLLVGFIFFPPLLCPSTVGYLAMCVATTSLPAAPTSLVFLRLFGRSGSIPFFLSFGTQGIWLDFPLTPFLFFTFFPVEC